jgi:hypothetical protein
MPIRTAFKILAKHNFRAYSTNFKNSKLSRHSGVSQTWSHSSSPTIASGNSISEACELYFAHARQSIKNDRNAAYSKRIMLQYLCYQDFYPSIVRTERVKKNCGPFIATPRQIRVKGEVLLISA